MNILLLLQQLADLGLETEYESAWQAFSSGLAATIRKLDSDEQTFHTLFAVGFLCLIFCGLCLPCLSAKFAQCMGTCCCTLIKIAGQSQYHKNGGSRVATNVPTDEEWAH